MWPRTASQARVIINIHEALILRFSQTDNRRDYMQLFDTCNFIEAQPFHRIITTTPQTLLYYVLHLRGNFYKQDSKDKKLEEKHKRASRKRHR